MDEYILTIIMEDSKQEETIKCFAETIEELLDNIVCMEYVQSIIHIMRVKDKKTWNIKDDSSLEMLREVRKNITNHKLLRNILIGKEEEYEKS